MNEPISEFRGPTRWLSNFEIAPVIIDGKEYLTNEHYFQACKVVTETGHESVRTSPTAAGAKREGRKVPLRPDWEEVKNEVMLKGLRAKFAPGSLLAYKLLTTKDRLLVEGNTWHDTYWGVCTCPQHQGKGLNTLGQLLMQVREELRQTVTICNTLFEVVTEGGGDADFYFCGRNANHEGDHADPAWPSFKP